MNHSGTVLQAFGLVIRSQNLDFVVGQVIEVDDETRRRIDHADAKVAWDGEVVPDSSTLAVNEQMRPPGASDVATEKVK